uniref:nuclear ubiquitous casein and cyclin-dependent kinase substrate 1-like n=1 Tax=Jaculus jaculus TaxID=51337 RepID=UPI001E1B373D|nr:nuclear ubiquitous casein and cyclin-dependent kinase substrate 1-like [Jaculus jaculus]
MVVECRNVKENGKELQTPGGTGSHIEVWDNCQRKLMENGACRLYRLQAAKYKPLTFTDIWNRLRGIKPVEKKINNPKGLWVIDNSYDSYPRVWIRQFYNKDVGGYNYHDYLQLTSFGKNSQEDSEDSEEKDVKTKKDDSHSAEDREDEKDDHKNMRQQLQAASKAASKQREMLLEDVGSEEELEEEDEAPFQEKDSGSDEDFLMEDDDDSDYGISKQKNKKVVKKSKPDRKEKKMPKPRLKATVTPSPVKGKGKVGRPTASKVSKEKMPYPKEEEEPESPPEKKASASPPPEKSGDEGAEDEAQSGED